MYNPMTDAEIDRLFRSAAQNVDTEDPAEKLRRAAQEVQERLQNSGGVIGQAYERYQMKQARAQILREAIGTYGEIAQADMMIEEMSELTKALLKLRRLRPGADVAAARDSIREEMADVQIMLDQMRMIFGTTDKIEVEKLERLKNRLRMDRPHPAPRGAIFDELHQEG